MTARKTVPFDDLLDTIMLDEPEPSYEALRRWQARYPEHRERLASLFATWAVQQDAPEDDEVAIDEERVHEAVLAHAQRILDKATPGLLQAAELAGISEDDLAARCDLDGSLVSRLDARVIEVATIPGELFRRLAEVLARSIEEVRQILDGPPVVVRATRSAGADAFAGAAQVLPGSDTTGLPDKIDFASAVRVSQLAPDLKRKWSDATPDLMTRSASRKN
jgi:hypothetical protein